MKKKILSLLIVLLVAVLAIMVAQKTFIKPPAIESVLPSGALGYVRVVNLEKNLGKFCGTKFWQTVKEIDFHKVMQNFGVSEQDLSQFDMFKQQLSSPDNQKLVGKFLGREFALAIYPNALTDLQANKINQAASNLFLVTRLGSEAKLIELVTHMLPKTNKDITVQTQKYKDFEIQVMTSKDGQLNIAFTRIKDLFVLSAGGAAVRQCIDVATKAKAALGQDPQLLTARSKVIADDELFGYVNYDLLMATVKNVIFTIAFKEGADNSKTKEQIEESFKTTQGFKTMVLSGSFNDFAKLKMDVYFDKQALNPDIRPMYECRPKDNQTLAFIPKNVLGYQWGECYDFNFYWKQSQKEMAQAREMNPKVDPQARVNEVEQELGLSIENDILPVLGDEVGGYLKDVNTAGLFPVPKLALFLKVKDKDKAEKLVQTLIAKQPLFRLETENYKDVAIKYFTIPLMQDLEPAYAFVSDYLLVSVNRSTVKESIDLSKEAGQGVVAHPQLQEMKIDLSQKANSVFFFQVDQLMAKASELVDWVNKWATTQMEKQKAFVKGSEQRLSDIKKNKEQWTAEVAKLNGEFDSLQRQAASVSTAGAPIQKIEGDIDRVSKFIQTINDNLGLDKKEEHDLLEIKNNPDMALPPEGENRLRETQLEIAKKQKKLEDLNAELQGLQQKKVSTQTSLARIEEIQKTLDQKKQDIQTADATEKELDDIIVTYQAQTVNEGRQQVMLNDLIKPMIRALANVKVVTCKIVVGDDVVEGYTFIRGE